MLIKFYSEQSAEFVMLGSVADQLLNMMGQGGSKEGAVSGEALLHVLQRLESGVTREHNAVSKGLADDMDENEGDDEPEEVMLSARAAPLVAMLRRAHDADGYVMWRPE